MKDMRRIASRVKYSGEDRTPETLWHDSWPAVTDRAAAAGQWTPPANEGRRHAS